MPQPPAAHTTPHAGGLARTPVVRPLVPSLARAVLLAALAPAGAALAQTMPAPTAAPSSRGARQERLARLQRAIRQRPGTPGLLGRMGRAAGLAGARGRRRRQCRW